MEKNDHYNFFGENPDNYRQFIAKTAPCKLIFMDQGGGPEINIDLGTDFNSDIVGPKTPAIFQDILDRYRPDKKLHHYIWNIEGRPSPVRISFQSSGDHTTGMLIQRDNIYMPDKTYIIVSLPLHPQKYLSVKSKVARCNCLVLADSHKLLDQMRRAASGHRESSSFLGGLHKTFYGQSERDRYADETLRILNTSLEKSIENVCPDRGYPGEAAHISFNEKEDGCTISIVNGWHRIANLARLNAPFIPIQIDKREAEAFSRRFGWDEAKAVKPCFRPS
jgi:hypothetical protein